MKSLALAALFLLADPAPATVTISGKLEGGTGKYTRHVALWDEASFLKKPYKEVEFEPGKPTTFSFEVPAGKYALSAYEDTNGDRELNVGMFGPKEPAGFWPEYSKWHTPKFDEVAFSAAKPIDNANVVLK